MLPGSAASLKLADCADAAVGSNAATAMAARRWAMFMAVSSRDQPS
jgi:hypothetical protein